MVLPAAQECGGADYMPPRAAAVLVRPMQAAHQAALALSSAATRCTRSAALPTESSMAAPRFRSMPTGPAARGSHAEIRGESRAHANNAGLPDGFQRQSPMRAAPSATAGRQPGLRAAGAGEPAD